ncbi:MAG: succinate--CoA ligase subunit beta, partial [Parachlamydiaceae bacterium]|nr:succinate--CoA ligase subunit beta [Parachlamydiaceae bacterium]
MDTHEHQAKIILREFNIPVPDFAVISHLAELPGALMTLNLEDSAVLKVQVHAGGRGKAGGVKLARTRQEIENYAKQLLGMRIINNQTGKQGVVSHTLMISSLVDVDKEYYMAVIIDRQSARIRLIASPDGGIDIEEVAEKFPDRVRSFPVGN